MKKVFALLLSAIMLMGVAAGCQKSPTGPGSGSGSGEKTPKDTITIIINGEPETLDPAGANADPITIVLNFVMENLFELGPDGEIYCELLESYDFMDDTTLHFKLKEGIRFSSGDELTSEDVMWELERLQSAPKSASHFAFIDIANSYIEDDYNFVLKFTQAWAPFSNTLSTGRGSIISKAAFEQLGETEFARAPIGTGPYKIVKWEPGTQIELTRNEYYHGEPAKTENLIIKFISEPTARVIELETGSADIAYYIEGTDISRVDSIDGYHIEQGDSYRYFTVCLSMQEPLFQDERVRTAMCYAIDKEALVRAATNGVGIPINGYCPSAMSGYIDKGATPYDVEQAKKLMAEAGYANGFTIDLHVQPESIYERAAEIIQSYWKEIGITTNIVSSALATYDAQHNGMFQASIRDGTATEISNVFIIYESSFGSRLNGNDSDLDKMLLDLRTYYYGDPARDAFLEGITEYLHQKRYSYPFMVMPTIYGVSDKLEGFQFHPAEDHMGNFVNWVAYS